MRSPPPSRNVANRKFKYIPKNKNDAVKCYLVDKKRESYTRKSEEVDGGDDRSGKVMYNIMKTWDVIIMRYSNEWYLLLGSEQHNHLNNN